MNTFESDGVEIAYTDEGDGDPILLIHGFASNIQTNWVDTSWVKVLTQAGRRVIAIDNRGHGASQKLYDPDKYAAPMMAGDAGRLLGHLEIERADVMGYSMGARITAFLTFQRPDKVRSAILAGLGINMVRGLGGAGPIATALEAPSIDDVMNETARTFRLFAESTASDLLALAACIRASRDKITREALAEIQTPVLVAVGTRDVIGGSAAKLAELIPGAQAFAIEGRDHMKAVGDKSFKEQVLTFLEKRA
jgi:pimeloyl-ACP methyl ester carboxylesterase